MEIIGKYDDSYPNSNLKRVFYTVEIEDGRFVDIMVSEESRVIYAMQNEDGSVMRGTVKKCQAICMTKKGP